jgi:CRISPR-associated protein Csb2
MPALLISVRFNDGRYHGTGDWPPAPARLFQALVAAAAQPSLDWARAALKWLEKLDAPVIAVPTKYEGQHVSLFVPNNDLDAKGGDIRRIAEVRSATKKIKPRLFDASVPLIYVWRFEGDDTPAKCVCSIADGLYQLGRGVDMAWADAEALDDEAAAEAKLVEYQGVIYRPSEGKNNSGGTVLDCPEDGSLESLADRYKAGAQRFRRNGDRTEFANAPKPRFRSVAYNSPATRLLFDLRRTTDVGSPFAPWPLKNTAALVLKLRDGAMDKLKKLNRSAPLDEGTINKVLMGRDATEADKALRIRIVPLSTIGHPHADRSIRRVLVEVPPDCPIRADDMAWAFTGLGIGSHGIDAETGEITSQDYWMEQLVTADDDSMLTHYGIGDAGISSRLWRSVTPLALPTERRHIDPAKLKEEYTLDADKRKEAKKGGERQSENRSAIHEVAQALRHAGLRHRIANIRVQREPFDIKGERAEEFTSGTRFSKHQLWHVEIEFSELVSGPIVLGNGRYLGLGLMAPAQKAEGLFSFSIIGGLAARANPMELGRALRRAVMARVQVIFGKSNSPLPLFFTGHEPNGAPARGNAHRHLAFITDFARNRLLIMAPHILEHRHPTRDERQYLSILAASLVGLVELRAGTAGKLELTSSATNADDPLLAPALRWESVTEYRVTRHPRRAFDRDALIADAISELARRNLPRPTRIEAIQCQSGPNGGITGRMQIEFATAVRGPILIGQTCHNGGGLFTPVPGAKQNDSK